MRQNRVTIVLLALIALVLIDQTRFLFVYPVPDTGMWFGDESWTMLTLRALIQSGVARVPEALGSSLQHSNGFINGCVWISGFLYGLPAILFFHVAGPVEIGRIVTFILSIVTIVFCYLLLCKLSIPRNASLFAILALVSSPVFYFSSHSARLDMATACAIVLYLYLVIVLFRIKGQRSNIGWKLFLLTFTAAISLSVYVHVPALIILPMIYSSIRLGAFQSMRNVTASIAGFALGTAILMFFYRFSTGSLTLLGNGYNQYYNVANSLPVLHLTSWRVQKINTIDRMVQLWDVAWPVVGLVTMGIIYRIRSRERLTSLERFLPSNAVLLLIGWGLFGGPAVFYNIYIVPTLAICAAVFLAPLFRLRFQMIPLTVIAFFLIGIVAWRIDRQEEQGNIGRRLTEKNNSAVASLLMSIASLDTPPLILTDEPAEHNLAGNPNVRLMTNHLLLFGEENASVPDILREQKVDYLLLYSSSAWHSPFQQLADSLYQPVGERIGTFTDLGRTYDRPNWNQCDTLRLYRTK